MSRPSHDRMHQLVKAEVPRIIEKLDDHLLKPARRVIVMEKHGTNWQDGQTADDRFMWVKGPWCESLLPKFTTSLPCQAETLS